MSDKISGSIPPTDTSGLERKLDQLADLVSKVVSSDMEQQISDGVQKGVNKGLSNVPKTSKDISNKIDITANNLEDKTQKVIQQEITEGVKEGVAGTKSTPIDLSNKVEVESNNISKDTAKSISSEIAKGIKEANKSKKQQKIDLENKIDIENTEKIEKKVKSIIDSLAEAREKLMHDLDVPMSQDVFNKEQLNSFISAYSQLKTLISNANLKIKIPDEVKDFAEVMTIPELQPTGVEWNLKGFESYKKGTKEAIQYLKEQDKARKEAMALFDKFSKAESSSTEKSAKSQETASKKKIAAIKEETKAIEQAGQKEKEITEQKIENTNRYRTAMTKVVSLTSQNLDDMDSKELDSITDKVDNLLDEIGSNKGFEKLSDQLMDFYDKIDIARDKLDELNKAQSLNKNGLSSDIEKTIQEEKELEQATEKANTAIHEQHNLQHNQTPSSSVDEQIEKLQKEEKQAEETREEIQKLNEECKDEKISGATQKFSGNLDEEKQKVDEVVDAEKTKFNELEDVIRQTIPEAIQKKNEAFQNEGDIVDEVVGGEIQKIKELSDYLDTLPQKIKNTDLSSIGKATKAASQPSVSENATSSFESAITEYITDLDKLQDKSQKAQQSIKEVIKASAKNDNAGNALETISNELNKLNETVYASPDEIKASQEEYRKYLELREKALAEGRNQAKQVDIQSNINSGEYSKQVDEVANKFKAWGATTETINEKLAEVRKSLKELNSAPIEKQIEAEKQFNVALKEANAEQKKYRSEMANSKNVAKWYKSIANWTNQNSAATKKYGAELKGMMNSLQNATSMSRTELDGIVKQFLRIQAEANRTGATGKSFFDQLSSRARSLAQYLMTYVSFQDLISGTRNVISTIKELDDELVDLSKTTTMSTSDMNAFYYEANDIAKQMGVTTQEIISQSSAWSRLGYNTKETSEEMAELSSQFASISPGMGTEKAQEGLVSIMKAFDIPVDEVKDKILNSINTLGNNFAESNQDIVEGMERSAAALAAVGTSFEDSIALFTGGQEVLQDAEKMGTALRSISMRIRSYNETSEEYDEELKNITGDLIDLTKTAEHSQGISVFKEGSTTEFKSLVDYLGEVSEIWDEMTDKQKNDYLQKAFAKTQAQSGAAILGNFDQVREALNKIEESSGSADAEMEKVTSSISYKMNELSETWTGTWQKLLDRGDLGSVVEMLTTLSEGLGFVIDKLGILGTLGLGTGAFLGAKDIGRSKMFDFIFSNV